MKVLMFGTYEAARVPRVRVIRQGLSRLGFDVTECNESLGLSPDQRLSVLQRPWRLHRLAIPMARSWWRLWRSERQLARPDVVIVPYMAHFDVLLAKLLFRRSTIVIDHLVFAGDTAADRRAGRVVQGLLGLIDEIAVRLADVVLVDTVEHRSLLGGSERKAVVVTVGAPEEWFRRDALPPSRPLRIVFFGIFTPLQGTVTIARAIVLCEADIEVTMIGVGQDHDQVRDILAGSTRVRWLDWVEPEELPSIIVQHHVCLGIFGDGPKARRVVPNKVFQACAAGRAVITSDTVPQRRLLDGAVRFVAPGDAPSLARAIDDLAAHPDEVERLGLAAAAHAEAAFGPVHVVEPLATRLGETATR